METQVTPAKTGKKKKSPVNRHFVNWFEIPALNFQRAVDFYNTIFDIDMETSEMPGYVMAFFPANKGIGGAVIQGEGCIPSSKGPLVYMNAGKEIDEIVGRIDAAGGRVLMPKTLISEEGGHFALFIDTEGNRLALHAKA
jgi:predicted enzyme related to lactoylglutathione lyase